MSKEGEIQYLLPAEPGCYPMTLHALRRLRERWPETVLAASDLGVVVVPLDSQVVGYDPCTSSKYVSVRWTPMVAIVEQGVVRTFLTWEAAWYKLALRGWWFGDSEGVAA